MCCYNKNCKGWKIFVDILSILAFIASGAVGIVIMYSIEIKFMNESWEYYDSGWTDKYNNLSDSDQEKISDLYERWAE